MLKKPLVSVFISTFIVAAAISVPVSAQHHLSHSARYSKYEGAWFDIDYPRGWKAMSYGRSASSVTGSDSAQFSSPDGSAEFYVFSPQWNGDPKEIALKPSREQLISHRVEQISRGKINKVGSLSPLTASWYTVRAKDNSYQRSWVDIEDKELNVRHVFGIKYRNAEIYRKYQPQYEHFKRSLQQYSD